MTNVHRLALICLLVAVVPSVAPAAPEDGSDPAEAKAAEPTRENALGKGITIIGVCFGAALSAFGGGMAIAKIGRSCMESIARQPEAGAQMFGPMVIGAAMIEGGMLFAILVCLFGIFYV